MRIQVTYDQIRRTTVKIVKCKGGCGKRLRRQRTFMQTMSPFNRNRTTGGLKTYGEIWTELGAEGARWEPGNTLCADCEQLQATIETVKGEP